MATTQVTVGDGEAGDPVPARPPLAIATADSAECTCPEPCERDHDRD